MTKLNRVKIIGISLISFSILVGLFFAFSQPTLYYEEIYYEELGESFIHGYTPIEDYILLPVLVEQGLNERTQNTRRTIIDNYKDTFLYEFECIKLFKEYYQIRSKDKIWHELHDVDFPNDDQFKEMHYTFIGSCALVDLTGFETNFDIRKVD